MPSMGMPQLQFSASSSARSGDLWGRNEFGNDALDGSGWTVNIHSTGSSGANQSGKSPVISTTDLGVDGGHGIPWLLVIGGLVVWKLLK